MLRDRGFAVCVAKAVSMASPFQWLRRFSLRCFYGFAVLCASHVSMASAFLAALFLASLFQWLRRSVCFARFNGYAVSRCAVSRFADAVSRCAVSMASPFQCLRRLMLTLFLLLRRGVPRHNNIEALCVAFLFKKSSIVSSI